MDKLSSRGGFVPGAVLQRWSWLLVALWGLCWIPTQPATAEPRAPHRPGYLTAASQRDALDIGRAYLRDHAARMGLATDDLADLHVMDRHTTTRTGTAHLYLRQHLGGIEIEGGDLSLAVDAEGRLLALQDRLVRGLGRLRARRLTEAPPIDGARAVLIAAAHLGLEPRERPVQLHAAQGPERAAVYAPAAISRDDIPVKLVYTRGVSGDLQLCWNLVIRTLDGRHWWNLYVDAQHGEVVAQNDWIVHETYRVFPLPQASPDEGARQLLADPADSRASPFGWHDTDGSPGAEFTDTRGNNAFAQEDVDADDSQGLRPDGGERLEFDFPLDVDAQPGNSLEASVANAFYLTNVVHDVLYHYGFDEAAGNFQQNNYGKGGQDDDPLLADCQDGAETNNARFGAPPDGFSPRMELFRWIQSPAPRLIVTEPEAIAGLYPAGPARFGAGTRGLTGSLVQALDAANEAGPTTTDGCSPLTNGADVAGNIALIDRGTCTFVTKVTHAQEAGGVGVVIANNAGDDIVHMAGVDPSIAIPSISIGQRDGARIAIALETGVVGQLVSVNDRDACLDAGVVVHEYAHGLTTRLTGGPSNANCLDSDESAAMGEGWSDWLALVMTAFETDRAVDSRGIATYLIGQTDASRGIRNAPYSAELGVNPFTYADIGALNQPHGAGEVWAAALWDMYWNYVDAYGLDSDLYRGSGGNNRALQLVVDALKLQPCDPTFVEARDALLAADLAATGGADACLIWTAFARRGIGVHASDGGDAASFAVTEDFEVPIECPEPGAAAMLLAGTLLLRGLAVTRRPAATERASRDRESARNRQRVSAAARR